eukprot:gene2971-585_t
MPAVSSVGDARGGGASLGHEERFADVALLLTDTAAGVLRVLFARAWASGAGAEYPKGAEIARRDGAALYAHQAKA